LKDVDFKALQDWVVQGVDELRKTDKEVVRARMDVKQELGQASAWVEKLRAAGATRLYAVLNVYDITADRPPFLVIPLEDGADAKAIQAIFNGSEASDASHPDNLVAKQIARAVVVAVPATLQKLKTLKPQARPELSRAFEAAGKGQIYLAVVPQEDARKSLESLATELPDELGGGSIEAVTRGMQWVCMAINLPPSPSMRHVIQALDAKSAIKLKDILDKAIAWAADRRQGPPEALAFAGLVAELKPRVEGDQVLIEVKEPGTRNFAAAAAANLLTARVMAKRTQAMSNLRQLSVAVFAYASDHQNELPKDLGPELNRYLGQSAKLVWNDPLRPNQKQPYVYIKLADKETDVKDRAKSVLIYENHSTWDDGITVGFADGHVEWIVDEPAFKQKLGETKKMNPGAVEMPQ
jgi:prepilin-type processing-associated H-X9-DG protein